MTSRGGTRGFAVGLIPYFVHLTSDHWHLTAPAESLRAVGRAIIAEPHGFLWTVGYQMLS